MSFSRYHNWDVLNSVILFLLYHYILGLGKTFNLGLVDGLPDQLLPDLIEKTILQILSWIFSCIGEDYYIGF